MDESVLVIADHRKHSVSRVSWGASIRHQRGHDHLLLEVACFPPDAIVGRARRYGLVTDASQRLSGASIPRCRNAP